MKDKIRFKDLSWPVKVGIIGGWLLFINFIVMIITTIFYALIG